MVSFDDLGLEDYLLKSVKALGFTEPTEIQRESIEYILQGKDVIGGSATGSGKTLAFGVGIIQGIQRTGKIQALVLVPTRELAEQVCESLNVFSKFKTLRILPVFGGVSYNAQVNGLKNCDVVVATPGRLLDHMNQGTVDLSRVKIFVLDEADRMVDMGFIDDVKKILVSCPKERQTLMFSATLSPEIEHIKNTLMKSPVKVSVTSFVDPKKLTQDYYNVGDKEKFSLLVHLLKQDHSGSIMVFCNTRRQVEFLEKNLKANNIDALGIHGGFTQAKRSSVMSSFSRSKVDALICTDVAARGLDIKDVSHIYNYDLPNDFKDYIHRIGRTARAGKDGRVVNVISSRDHSNFSNILSNIDVFVSKQEVPKFERAVIKASSKEQGSRFAKGRTPSRFGGKSFGNKNNDRRERSPNRTSDSERSPDRESRGNAGRESRGNSGRGPNRDSRGTSERGPSRDSRGNSERGSNRDSRSTSERSSSRETRGTSERGPNRESRGNSGRGPSRESRGTSERGPNRESRGNSERGPSRDSRSTSERPFKSNNERTYTKSSKNDSDTASDNKSSKNNRSKFRNKPRNR